MSAMRAATPGEGDLLWTPSQDVVTRAGIAKFLHWLASERGLDFQNYEALRRWSVTDLEAFWRAIWDCYDIVSDVRPEKMVSGAGMLDAIWCEDARLNYAEHLLRFEAIAPPDKPAFVHSTETRPLASLTWQDLGTSVRALATALRALGIRPGDCVVCYMPNIPETAIAMLATIAIGGIWSSAAPEFGARTVLERFEQCAPKVAFVADGYTFNGKSIDRRAEIKAIASGLPSLQCVVWLPYLGEKPNLDGLPTHQLETLMKTPAPARDAFRFERVAHDHPLWILFSSGTTGKPKAIVHGHAGMTLEHHKSMNLQWNMSPDRRMFFYTTTGWMMWNAVMSSLITGATAVLYDGSPTHRGADQLWRLAAEAKASTFGVSPTLVRNMRAAGIRPCEIADFSNLECVALGGAPASPDVFAWIYDEVKRDVWLTCPSGGTELCSSLIAGVPIQPVFAGETQARALAMDVHAWSDSGEELINQVGELVVTKPFPSMPLHFCNDPGKHRYREAYFDVFPGVWRHGDLIKINERGGCYLYGRSDSTLNRNGVRIGAAEIYAVVQEISGVRDCLAIGCEFPGGRYFMPLFVSLDDGQTLDSALKQDIAERLRLQASPRHVPDDIIQAPSIPYTLTGKKMEVPIRRILMGASPEAAASREAMSNPDSLDFYAAVAQRPEIAAMRAGVENAKAPPS